MYKVVFVDDEEQNLLLMEKIIDWEELGFRVSGMALDGDEGLEMYREIQPDLMLVDIKMDEMDGLSLIRKLREEYRAEETLFIIVTAYDEFSYAQQAIRLNVENYLLKPLERQKMAEMVRKIICAGSCWGNSKMPFCLKKRCRSYGKLLSGERQMHRGIMGWKM